MKQLHGHFALRTSARLLLSSIAALSFSTLIHAEQTLDNITVTANRMPSANVLAPNTVITRDDIDRLQINDLGTLLSRQTGIDMTNNGGIGKATSISIRGSNSSHVLVLVDGVKWHSATTGGPSIQDFPVEQIERIEVVRGPRSGIYGSEAIGGVIQIFTRKGKAGDIKPYAKLAYGSHNSKQAAVGVSGGDAKTTYNLSFNHQSTDGINVKDSPTQDPDKDGYRNNSVSAKINHQLTNNFVIGANLLRSEGFNEYDSKFDFMKADSIQQIIGTNAALQ
ncbi:MAG TPA: cobalamin receptor, partial [Methylophaga sp.]|nr:cobalamin receptor [Methylophaga sp.]